MGLVDGPRSVNHQMPHKQVLAKNSPAIRKNQRSLLGSLKSIVVSQKTLSRYDLHVSKFLQFLHDGEFTYPSSFYQLDVYVCSYIEHLWEEGESKSWAGDVLSGLGHFIPSCKQFLTGGWRLHSAWGRAELPARALPFTPLLLYSLVQLAVERDWIDTAVMLALGFHVYPRSGELFNAHCGDFQIADNLTGVWSLPLTKSGQRFGAKESVLLTDPWIGLLLKNFLAHKLPGDPFSSVSGGTQRKRLTDLLKCLKITDEYRWYSLRRGGATHAYRKSNNMAAVCYTGRWGNAKTARIYITDALAHLTEQSWDAALKRRLKALALKARPNFEDC